MTLTRKIPLHLQSLFSGLLALGMLLVSGSASPASAHSFNTVMLLPAPYNDVQLRRDMMQAFLLASEERDGHPDETSNGHLGGLDVFVIFTTEPGTGAHIIATPLAGVPMPYTNGPATLGPPDLTSKTAIALLTTPADPSLPPFASRFEATIGQPPGPEAKAVYVTARLIGLAVRMAGGVDDPTLLRRLLLP
jgi:hypothetical protein